MNTSSSKYGLVGVLVVALSLYAATAARSVTMEDSGEFLLVAQFLGLPHPPGYPLFVLLGHLASLGPGVPAVGVMAGAFACAVIYVIVARLTRQTLCAVGAALVLMVCASFWSQAVVTEVYALNAFLFALVAGAAIAFGEQPTKHRLRILAFAVGLALTNHWPLTVLALPALAFPVWQGRRVIVRHLLEAGAFLGLGLSPYLYLLLAHHFSDYLFSGALVSAGDFAAYVLRREYHNLDVTPYAGVEDWWHFTRYFFEMLITGSTAFAWPIALLGLIAAPRRIGFGGLWALCWALISSSLVMTLFWRAEFYGLTRELYESWQLIPMMAWAVAFGLGLAFLLELAGNARWVKPLLVAYTTLVVVASAHAHYAANDLSDDRFGEDYGKAVLESLPERAVLLVRGDADAGPIAYTHAVLGIRPDVVVTSQVGALLPKRIFDRHVDIESHAHYTKILNYIEGRLSEGRRVFTTRRLAYFDDDQNRFPMQYVEYGLFLEIRPAAESHDALPPPPSPRLVDVATTFLDRLVAGAYATQFAHYRDATTASFCHVLLLHGKDHPALTSNASCRLVLAQWLYAHEHRYDQADALFRDVLTASEGIQPLYERVEIGRQLLVNRVRLSALAPELATKKRLLQDATDGLLPLALRYNVCENRLALNLLEISDQVGTNLDRKDMRRVFGTCSKHALILNKTKE